MHSSMANERNTGATSTEAPKGLIAKLRTTLEMIKFEHSIFALPFALVGAMLAVRGWPTWRQVLWLIVAMVGARSAAMTFNRIADRKLDALNPRTRMRALPAGRLTLRFAVGFTVLSCGLLVLAALGTQPAGLQAFSAGDCASCFSIPTPSASPCSRTSCWEIADGLSPIAAWIALRNDVSLSVLLLGAAVAFWVGGFDLIYACQDIDFDRPGHPFFPPRFGVAAALYGSAFLHLLMVALLVAVVRLENLGWLAMAGLIVVACYLPTNTGSSGPLICPASMPPSST